MNEAKLHSFLIFKVGERAGEMACGLGAFHLVEDPDSVPMCLQTFNPTTESEMQRMESNMPHSVQIKGFSDLRVIVWPPTINFKIEEELEQR